VLRAGAAWGEDGYIYFDTAEPHGLVRVAASGGSRPEPVFADSLDVDVLAHAWPSLLPGGAGALFTIWRNTQSSTVAAIDFGTGSVRELAEGIIAAYSTTGHLVYVEPDGSMFAAPFDPRTYSLTGAPVLLQELGDGFQHLVVSSSGRLAYTSVPPTIDEAVWVDLEGNESPIDASDPLRNVRYVSVSPDGRRLAINTREHPTRDDSHVWIKELPDGPLTRLTFDGVVNFRPEWFAGGDSVLFISDRGGNRDVWKQRADGSGRAELVFDDSVDIDEALISPDGRWLVYREGSQDGERDIYARLLGSDGPAIPVAATEFDEVAPALSPDGRWLAYGARVDDQWDVYLRPFPEGVGQWRVSRGGGYGPVWSATGRELFYQIPSDHQAVVSVMPGSPLSLGAERTLFPMTPYWIEVFHRGYDVAPSAGAFVMVRGYASDTVDESLFVVENFPTELRRRVPD
jgi:dipeptidyl aminopeptidase/acylaminoacyl peptidase